MFWLPPKSVGRAATCREPLGPGRPRWAGSAPVGGVSREGGAGGRRAERRSPRRRKSPVCSLRLRRRDLTRCGLRCGGFPSPATRRGDRPGPGEGAERPNGRMDIPEPPLRYLLVLADTPPRRASGSTPTPATGLPGARIGICAGAQAGAPRCSRREGAVLSEATEPSTSP